MCAPLSLAWPSQTPAGASLPNAAAEAAAAMRLPPSRRASCNIVSTPGTPSLLSAAPAEASTHAPRSCLHAAGARRPSCYCCYRATCRCYSQGAGTVRDGEGPPGGGPEGRGEEAGGAQAPASEVVRALEKAADSGSVDAVLQVRPCHACLPPSPHALCGSHSAKYACLRACVCGGGVRACAWHALWPSMCGAASA